MFQTVWFIIRGFSGFLLGVYKGCYKNLNEKLRKPVLIREIA